MESNDLASTLPYRANHLHAAERRLCYVLFRKPTSSSTQAILPFYDKHTKSYRIYSCIIITKEKTSRCAAFVVYFSHVSSPIALLFAIQILPTFSADLDKLCNLTYSTRNITHQKKPILINKIWVTRRKWPRIIISENKHIGKVSLSVSSVYIYTKCDRTIKKNNKIHDVI